MDKKRFVSLIVFLVVLGGFLLSLFYMASSKSHRDGFVNTVKDIKNKPFMGLERKRSGKLRDNYILESIDITKDRL